MEENVMQRSPLTRRSFLRTTALTAGVAALAGAAGCTSIEPSGDGDAGTELVAEEKFRNVCRGNCGGTCHLDATVREGKIVKITPKVAPDDLRELQTGCVKGQTTPQRIYATNRVLHPMKQAGEKGSDNWEQITWDEAIALIVEKFQGAMDEYGASSIALWHSFGGSGYLGGSTYFGLPNATPTSGMTRMVASYGVAQERFIQKTGITAFLPSSDMGAIYGSAMLQFPMNSREDLVNAKTILIWGANPADAYKEAWPFICKARENGAKVITIDPYFTASAALSDMWVPVRVGTDSALMLAICNYVIDNDLVDYDYMKNGSVGPLLVKEDGTYLRLSDLGMEPAPGPIDYTTGEPALVNAEVVYDEATQEFGSSWAVKDPALEGSFEVNGIKVRTVFDLVKENIKQFTVEFAAKECDVPAEQIIEIAKTYANNKPASVHTCFGFEHTANCSHNYRSLVLLGSLTGNMNKAGASIAQWSNASKHTNFVLADTSDLIVEDAKPSFSMTGEYLASIMDTGKWGDQDFTIRCLYVMNANPLSSGLGRTAMIEAFKKVDFIVTADSFMTDTARWSDLVLPIAMSWECEDFLAIGYGNYMMMNKAIEPAGECKTDLDVFRLIAAGMGYDDLYGKTDEEYLKTYLNTPENEAVGCTYDAFKERGQVGEYELISTVGAEYNATGRSMFYLETVVPRDYYGQTFELKDRIPWYEHAAEAYADNPLREKFPLFAMSRHENYRGQSLFNQIPWLDELQGEPKAFIHADTAAERGIADGDTIRVYNDRGYVVLKAALTEGIRPDTVMLPHGPQEEDFIEGHNQALTLLCLDPYCSNNNYNDMLCQVEKYEGGVA